MRAVVQRVKSANVKINGKVNGAIRHGLMVLLAIKDDDTDKTIEWMANKLVNLRIFPDDEGKMNRSVTDVGGGILLISNFTLYGDVKKGYRPSYSHSAGPAFAEPVYKKLVEYLNTNYSVPIETGIFGAMMDVELINDGPVTVIIEK